MPEHSLWLLFSAESIVDSVREPLLVLDADLRVMRANRSFYTTFQMTPAESENRLVYDLGDRQWDIPALRTPLEQVLPRDAACDDFEVEQVSRRLAGGSCSSTPAASTRTGTTANSSSWPPRM